MRLVGFKIEVKSEETLYPHNNLYRFLCQTFSLLTILTWLHGRITTRLVDNDYQLLYIE